MGKKDPYGPTPCKGCGGSGKLSDGKECPTCAESGVQ